MHRRYVKHRWVPIETFSLCVRWKPPEKKYCIVYFLCLCNGNTNKNMPLQCLIDFMIPQEMRSYKSRDKKKNLACTPIDFLTEK